MDLSTIAARKQIAGKWATKYGLDPILVCALAAHESSWNPWACRFEPGFLSRYVHPANPSAPTTREITLATSFGLLQIMGEVAVEFGFPGRYLTELCDPDTGMDYGCRKLQKCFSIHGDVESSLLAYNGGGDPNYPAMVLGQMALYQGDESGGGGSGGSMQ